MRTNDIEYCGLKSTNSNKTMVLKSVHMEGKLTGYFLEMSINQHYKNETGSVLETVYTFPLPWQATMTGMTVSVDDKQLNAVVLEKKEAEQNYEKAIEEGDMPIMVETNAEGLYTANIGNIKPGQSVRITIQYAQLTSLEQGRMRLAVPTVISPRYGNAHQTGGLAPHETTDVNLKAYYPLTLKLDIAGNIDPDSIYCPSHPVAIQKNGENVTVSLQKGAALDRDFILNIENQANKNTVVAAPDGTDNTILLSSIVPSFTAKKTPLNLKVLIDCSSSMHGERIDSAKEALHHVLEHMTPEDTISLSCFGNTVRHYHNTMQACTAETLENMGRIISGISANMGGTEMGNAILSTINDVSSRNKTDSAPLVLLITDGDVWATESIIASSKQTEHRIFVIGVGSSSSENLLRNMAKETGGACELVSPNEDMEEAIIRTFHRMNSSPSARFRVHWTKEPLWQTNPPQMVYSGDIIHIFARLGTEPERVAENLPNIILETDDAITSFIPKTVLFTDSCLDKLGAAHEIAETDDSAIIRQIALEYQLVSEETNLFLVHEHLQKTDQQPTLVQIEQMMAAGYGGYGNTRSDLTLNYCCDMSSPEIPERSSGIRKETVLYSRLDTSEIYDRHLENRRLLVKLLLHFQSKQPADFAKPENLLSEREKTILNELAKELDISSDILVFWAILVDWLVRTFDNLISNNLITLNRHTLRKLRTYLRTIPSDERDVIESELSRFNDLSSWD